MTITNGYCTLSDVKHSNRLNINDSDSDSNGMLEAIIESVSRKFDDRCNRVFYMDSSEVVRYYTAIGSDYLFVDDIASPSSDVTIKTDTDGDGTMDDTWANSDFILSPYNAEDIGVPYQKIETSTPGQFLFPMGVRKGVQVTAKWGWPGGVPKPIVEACKLQSERIFMRASTPIGSTSMTALGKQYISIPGLDPDVENMISRYIKIVFG